MAHENEIPVECNREADLPAILAGEAGLLLRDYANISPEKQLQHCKRISREGWKVLKYPCFPQYRFLGFDLARSPAYEEILLQVRQGHHFLDLGCGLGQDIRRLVYDGAPPDHLIGLDMTWEFIDLGFELFQDKPTLGSNFIVQNFFEDTTETRALSQKVNVINSGYFMHLFDWDTQLKIAKRILTLLSPRRGAFITGLHFGSDSSSIWENVPWGDGPMFVHSVDTLGKLWDLAASDMGTSCTFYTEVDRDDQSRTLYPGGCRLRWVVERQ